MYDTVELGKVIGSTTVLAHEAVAIVQQLISSSGDDPGDAAAGQRLTADQLTLSRDGAVSVLDGRRVSVSQAELADLMQLLLPHGVVRVPAALRYAIARAAGSGAAPPFESLADMATVLQRFEQGDRRVAVQAVVRRVLPDVVPPPAVSDDNPPHVERRSGGTKATALRRELRRADEELFTQKEAFKSSPGVSAGVVLALPAAAVLLSMVAGYGLTTAWQQRTIARMSSPRIEASHAAPRDPAMARDDRSGAGAPRDTQSDDHPDHDAPLLLSPQDTGRTDLTRAIADDSGPQYSPAFDRSGGSLFFHRGGRTDARSAIMAIGPGRDAATAAPLIDDGSRNYHAQPSPDGRLIAFDSDRDGERGVYVASADGRDVRRVSGTGYASVPTWAPAGDRLAFIRAEANRPRVWNLWMLSLATGEMRRLTDHRYGQTWGASWFPDGRRICYAHDDRLVVLDLEDDGRREYRTPVDGHALRTPAVSPQGDRIVFQAFGNGVWVLDLQSATMRQILADRSAEEFAWSPDGRRIAFHSKRDGTWRIWTLTPGPTADAASARRN